MAHHSHVISTLIRTENRRSALSLIGCITFAIFGIGYGLLVGSNAIMLDGISSLFTAWARRVWTWSPPTWSLPALRRASSTATPTSNPSPT